MSIVTVNPQSLRALEAIAAALAIAAGNDQALERAADGVSEILRAGTWFSFDGVELRVASSSDPDMHYVTDGTSCTCLAKKHPWCKHRAFMRVCMGYVAMLDPFLLIGQVLEQCADPTPTAHATATFDDGFPPDSIFDDRYFGASPRDLDLSFTSPKPQRRDDWTDDQRGRFYYRA